MKKRIVLDASQMQVTGDINSYIYAVLKVVAERELQGGHDQQQRQRQRTRSDRGSVWRWRKAGDTHQRAVWHQEVVVVWRWLWQRGALAVAVNWCVCWAEWSSALPLPLSPTDIWH